MYKEKENPLREKSYAYALAIVKICRQIQKTEKEYVLTKQLLRSSTSIGANIEEAIGGQSSKDFVHKISISYKEARESHYWLRLMRDSEIIEKSIANELIALVEELLRIMTSIQKTMKSKLNS
ncbi:MAG: four helix bundle protein [Bacteroidetes bacterium]|nr:MAG: four helix bundle protein [Bacteroidota bacterium]MBL1145685.1 four helix bundle protein [Bacteroidota bacterium]NOG58479.1 four helix bundle protein [Bacteroidota bacterium]